MAVDAGLHRLLAGDLTRPHEPRGVVAFAHGSGSSRLSPRNRAVSAALNRAGIATLLFDLLTPAEETDRHNVFDIALLAHRLVRPASSENAGPASAACTSARSSAAIAPPRSVTRSSRASRNATSTPSRVMCTSVSTCR